MNASRRALAGAALKGSLELRMNLRLGLQQPVCIYDICEKIGISVWFADIPSMEGIYLPNAQPRPAIIVSSLRPAGRRAITCGHELGHHYFGHGEQWDQVVERRDSVSGFQPNEYQVDLFSTSFHMPKLAVCHSITTRQIDLRTCKPEQIYALSCWFGVGYGTFIKHACSTLNLLSDNRGNELLRFMPRNIRREILGGPCPENLIVVDRHWIDRPIDVQVGDLIAAPPGTSVESDAINLEMNLPKRNLIRARRPGIGRICNMDIEFAAFVRVSRKQYIGRAPYRFDEEVDDD